MSSNLHEIYIKIKDEATKGLQSIQKGVDGMLENIERHKEGIQSIGVASGVAFAGFGMGIKSAVSTFADFEEKMSGVKAVLNPTTEEMKKLTEQAEILGATTKFSALETAEGTEMLARNGLNAQQILGGALEATLNLAAATGTDIATAADIATDAMASFGLQTENLGQVMNSITGVTNASKFAIEDYKYALAAGGGVAAALGVELEDFNTVIAATSSRFAGGSDAGTSFKTFMQRLVPASKEAMGAMKDLGLVTFDNKKAFDELRDLGIKPASDSFDDISKAVNSYAKKMKMTEKQVQKFWQELGNQNEFYTAEGNLKSMAEISEILKEATKDLSEEQKNQALSTIFGSDALRTAMGLAEVGAEKFAELQKSIEGTDASENAKTRMDNLKGTFEELGGAVDSVKIALGRSLAPTIKQVTIFFQDIAQEIGVWAAKNPELVSTIMLVATAVTGIIAVMAGFALALGPIISGLSLLGTIIGALISPIGLVIGAIVALGVAYTTNFMGFKDIVDSVVGWISEKLQIFGAFLTEVWNIYGPPFIESVTLLWESLKVVFETAFLIIRQNFENFLNGLKILWEIFGPTITEMIRILWETIKAVFSTAFGVIKTIVDTGLKVIKGIFDIFAGVLAGDWTRVWNGIKEITTGLVTGIINFIKEILTGIMKWIGGVFGIDLLSAFTNVWERVKEATIGIVTGMVDKVKGILEGIKSFISGIVGAITGAGEEASRVQASVRSSGGGGGIAGARASGGPVSSGSQYLVGERGPELFVPQTSGYIVPNKQLSGGATIQINMGGVIVKNEADENRLAEKISQKLAREAKLYKLGIS